MSRRVKRVLFYLTLAAVCYAIAFTVGGRVAFGVFLFAGAVGELCMWKELLFGS